MANISKYYSPAKLWKKCKSAAEAAGSEVIQKSLWLYFALENPDTPAWAKATIVSAIAYFIMPVDAIPDAIPVVGYTDDLATLAAAVATVGMNIGAKEKRKARAKMRGWGM